MVQDFRRSDGSYGSPDSGTFDVDIAVVGGGVVGLAVAQRLAQRWSVAILERHEGIARETSSHNSGVIHASIYYPTGSLKHRLCLEGNGLLYEWAAAHSVPHERCGKLIVALEASEIGGLDAVYEQATRNEAPGIERWSGEQARELEPYVPIAGAIWSPSTGVIDAYALARSYLAEAETAGALLATHHEVRGIEREGGGFRLELRDASGAASEMRCGVLVNAAGLNAPAIASLLGYPLDGGVAEGVTGEVPVLRQRINRGIYYDVVNPAMARRVSRPIYPLPEHAAGGLGLHLTTDTEGGVRLGPNTEWLDGAVPLDYHNPESPTLRDQFLAAGRRFLPDLEESDIARGQVGYRPKLQLPGGEQADFLVWHDRGYVHLGGIESPGLTSSLALAREVEERLA